MTRAAPYRPAVMMAGQTDRAGADDRDHVARLDVAVADADLEAGRQDVGQHHRGFVGDAVGQLVQRVVGEGDAHDSAWVPSIRWPRIHPMPDGAFVGQAVREESLVAVGAGAARGDAGDDHAVADVEGRDGADPICVIVPTPSWPRMRPSVTAGRRP